MVRQARADHVPVSLEIETKHPNPRGARVELRVAEMLSALRWDVPGSPVRVISFDRPAVKRLGRLLPGLERTFLIENRLGRWASGRLFDGVRVVGPDLALIRADPDFVARAHARGNRVNVWTVNEPDGHRVLPRARGGRLHHRLPGPGGRPSRRRDLRRLHSGRLSALRPIRYGVVTPSYIRCAIIPSRACSRLWQWSIQIPGLSATKTMS